MIYIAPEHVASILDSNLDLVELADGKATITLIGKGAMILDGYDDEPCGLGDTVTQLTIEIQTENEITSVARGDVQAIVTPQPARELDTPRDATLKPLDIYGPQG